MRVKGIIITVFAAFVITCSAAATDVFGQKVERPPHYIGPPIVEQDTDQARYPIDRQPRRHKKYAHGYRNYGQYRRTQVGNRRYRYVNRYYWNNGVRVSRRVRVYF